MPYIRLFFSVVFQHGLVFWSALILAYLFGVGWYSDWRQIRAVLVNWPGFSSLPETLSFWWLLLPFVVWVCLSCVHRETMRRLRAGKVEFGELDLHEDVKIYTNGTHVTSIDILSVYICNVPYDSLLGHAIEHAFGSVAVYDEAFKPVLNFDYPRWTDNPQPGYQGSPSDHFPHEWNFRTLQPNASKNRMDLFTKEIDLPQVRVLRGITQLNELWRDKDFTLEPGTYKVLLRIKGQAQSCPANLWIDLINLGEGKRMQFSKIEADLFGHSRARMKRLEKLH